MPRAKIPCPKCTKPYRPYRDDQPECGDCYRKRQETKRLTGKPPITIPGEMFHHKVMSIIKKRAMSPDEIAEELDLKPSERYLVLDALEQLQDEKFAVELRTDGRYVLAADVAPGGRAAQKMQDRGDGWSVLGFVSDTHLGSPHERLDVLNKLYDIYAEEGVTNVYHGGNWIEGESRFNRHDVKVFGMTAQLDYFLEYYPVRPGITTHYVAGDDHEGWYQQRERVIIGEYLEEKALKVGRADLHYLGYVEADVELTTPSGASTCLRVMHGGGGSAYAYSYVLQKQVESYQGGEKPSILCMGHHHKFDYCYPRNVHAFMPGCTEDQSIFMRKKKIEAHVGGVLVRLKQSPEDGHVTRFDCCWMPFYDRGYYQNFQY
jgi:predicted phosphodiesterase